MHVQPIWGVFSVQGASITADSYSPAEEQRQGVALVDAAISHGHVRQFVYASVDRGGSRSDSDPTPVPHFASKYYIEKHLIAEAQETAMGYTILRPTAFMENFAQDFSGKLLSMFA